MRILTMAAFWLVVLAGCNYSPSSVPVPSVQESGELVVLTRNSPTTYFEDAEGNLAGMEHDLVVLFARELGVKVRFVVADQFAEILPDLQSRKAHFAAAGINITPERQARFRFSLPYHKASQQLVYNSSGGVRPKKMGDLTGLRIEVVAGSSFAEQLRAEKVKHPSLLWKESSTEDSEELLDRLAMGQLDAVVAYSDTVAVAKNFLPTIDVAFDLTEKQPFAWVFPKEGDAFVYEKSKDFFSRIEKDGTLKRLLDRYYGHVNRLDRVDVERFLIDANGILPRFRKLFRDAQEQTDLDWRLLAVVGYQESHWNPLATSPTGVRGLMMLTNDTADRLGVSDRLDAKQSIYAGSKYIAFLRDQMPDRIQEPDRTWLALASYNIGYGHLEDARTLAKQMKLNPDSWTDLKTTLPLLAKAEYRNKVKHGYARGGETVIFVETIRTYFDILSRFEKPHQPEFDRPVAKIVLPKGTPRKLVESGTGIKPPAGALLPEKTEAPTEEDEH
ncbi:MAG: membrane-bound lytic murein transglycosylase MltF [Sulfuricellaceae bacterium]|nr:membrane-bound lytic murein transglycosylase MltF [Sulfuricellaceae bacterium]